MTLNADRLSHRLSWRGVLAGMVMGLVTTFTLLALGTVITALTGLTLSGVGIAAAIWSGIAALVGAYVAGLTAVRAAAPATRNDDGIAAMTHEDATLTGLVTAGMIVLLSTLFAFNSASRLLGTATATAGNVLGAGATATAAAGTVGAQSGGVQDFISGINEDDIVDLIAGNSEDLNEQQVQATSNVVSGIFRRAQYDLGQQDLGNITDFAGARVTAIKNALTGEQFVTRLERQGLSAAQAQEVRTVVTTEVDRLEKQAQQVADATERTARTAASTAGWAWLLAAGLTIGASVFGARSAATHRAIAVRR
ncbi:hypothetical protein [Deinococcus aquaticus]|uniref:hypothetical protein n=1 Tax=Deinococcus aquaticus TaxID=328692 RepID=UPI003F44F97A